MLPHVYRLTISSLGGGSLLTMSASKSPGGLKMSRTVMDSFNETVKKAPKVKLCILR